ncbi:MAG: hypothetical protein IKT60_06410 [Clostridia bacterium]|nr:hypothetical protein [Clostridia bacterium]
MKLRRIIAVLLCVAMLLSLAACGQPRTAATSDQFVSSMLDKGFEVKDMTEDLAAEEYIKTAVTADKKDVTVEFYILDKEDTAKGNVTYFADKFKALAAPSASEKVASSANYSYYEQKSTGVYRLASSVGDTFLYVEAFGVDLATEAEELAKALGYAAK